MVADNIFQIVKALQLIGTKTMITGIRPEIAQTVVDLGVDFGTIKTRATLEKGLEEIGFSKLPENSQRKRQMALLINKKPRGWEKYFS
ncbi:STAS domain-containing protein [Priestia megaterium]